MVFIDVQGGSKENMVLKFCGFLRYYKTQCKIKSTKIVARLSLCFVGIAMNSKRDFIASFIFLIKCNAATRPLIFFGNVVSFSIINTTPVKNVREMNSNSIFFAFRDDSIKYHILIES